jgi:hypothetical protein
MVDLPEEENGFKKQDYIIPCPFCTFPVSDDVAERGLAVYVKREEIPPSLSHNHTNYRCNIGRDGCSVRVAHQELADIKDRLFYRAIAGK